MIFRNNNKHKDFYVYNETRKKYFKKTCKYVTILKYFIMFLVRLIRNIRLPLSDLIYRKTSLVIWIHGKCHG